MRNDRPKLLRKQSGGVARLFQRGRSAILGGPSKSAVAVTTKCCASLESKTHSRHDKTNIEFSFNTFAVSHTNEDCFNSHLENVFPMFALFDGHNGAECAQFLSKNLLPFLTLSWKTQVINKTPCQQAGCDVAEQQIPRSETRKGSADLDSEPCRSGRQERSMIRAVRQAFAASEESFLALNLNEKGNSPCAPDPAAFTGSSACVVVLTDRGIILSNLGETCVVGGLSSRSAPFGVKAVPLTRTHTLSNDSELQNLEAHHRDERLVGSVIHPNGSLKGLVRVTRSIGDCQLKTPEANSVLLPVDWRKCRFFGDEPYLSAEPECVFLQHSPALKFVIIGSSGFWQHISHERAVVEASQYYTATDESREKKAPDVATHLLRLAMRCATKRYLADGCRSDEDPLRTDSELSSELSSADIHPRILECCDRANEERTICPRLDTGQYLEDDLSVVVINIAEAEFPNPPSGDRHLWTTIPPPALLSLEDPLSLGGLPAQLLRHHTFV